MAIKIWIILRMIAIVKQIMIRITNEATGSLERTSLSSSKNRSKQFPVFIESGWSSKSLFYDIYITK
jgi:hypothetical protein